MVLTAPQNEKAASPQAWLRGVSDGNTRVVDMTYAINGTSIAGLAASVPGKRRDRKLVLNVRLRD
jgi:hypothetical protein